MYSVTLEINQKCNLKCKYCYLGEKDNIEMNINDAIKSINIGINQLKKHRDKILMIDFVGGEATIDFKFIKDLVAYSINRGKESGVSIEFSITTNALLLNKNMIDFFIEKGFLLKISIDGNKAINDLNRITVHNKGSYENIIDKISLLRYYEEKTKKPVQVTNVITKNNYKEYYNSLVHITRDLGFKFIDTAIDLYAPWTYDEYKIIEKSIYKSFDYFIDSYNKNNPFVWTFINKAHSSLYKRKRVYSCGGGIVSLYVKNTGDFYPCPVSSNIKAMLGSTNNGIYDEKVNELKNITEIDNNICKECKIYEYCSGKSCIMLNLEVNGDKYKPVDMVCWLEKLSYKLIREKKEIFMETFGGYCNELIRA